MSDYGITGIGNPYINGLGMYGLGVGSSYGTYPDPTMSMGMMGYPNSMGMGMMGMGMYNPAFMSQMNQAYQDMEKSQLQHASAMHEVLKQNEVANYKTDDWSLTAKSIEDTGIEGQVVNLAEKVREGDADNICAEFDKLKIMLYQKYNKELKENSDRIDAKDWVNHRIEELYAHIISQKTGEQVSLRNDIKRYGETAFMHGFNKEFFGKKDYHNKYTEETLSYLFETGIDNKGGKDRMQKIGGITGSVAEAGVATTAGAGVGLLASLICKGGKFGKTIGALCTAGALFGDIAWQMSRD